MGVLATGALLLFVGMQTVYAADTVTVTIHKYVDGAQATAGSAQSMSFPMSATWNADNIGAGTGAYALDTSNSYQTMTTDMSSGADYATNEITGGDAVGAVCAEGKPFELRGYTWGDTLAEAQAGTPTLTPPSFVDLTSNKYVIVWNHDCTMPETVTVTIDKYVDGTMADASSADNSAFPMVSSWNAVNTGAGTGSYTLSPVGFNSANPYEAITSDMTSGATYSTNEDTSGDVVGASCEAGKPFALVGYTSGNTPSEAQAGTPSAIAPSFANVINDKYVIVWNETCEPSEQPATSTVQVTIVKYVGGEPATTQNASSSVFAMNAVWNDTQGIGSGSGTYELNASSSPAYQAETIEFNNGADYGTSEVLGTNVGATCAEGKPYALGGYKTGDTMQTAASSTATTTAPAFTNMQTDKFVIVWNVACANGEIIGDVEGQGTLAVTSIDAVDTSATADNTYENGWKYVFHITAPTDEPDIAMKFTDWTSGSSTIPVANNMRISSAQASSTSTVTVLAADTYTVPDLHLVTDLNPSMIGIQFEVTVEVKIPVGTPNASYSTGYGVRSQ